MTGCWIPTVPFRLGLMVVEVEGGVVAVRELVVDVEGSLRIVELGGEVVCTLLADPLAHPAQTIRATRGTAPERRQRVSKRDLVGCSVVD